MGCIITGEPGYLRAELFRRESAEETRAFFHALECKTQRRLCILISVRTSNPLPQVDFHELTELLAKSASGVLSHKIALVGDSEALRASFEHVALLEQQRGFNVRNFQTEAMARHWLTEWRYLPDRRSSEDPSHIPVQPRREDQRKTQRRRFNQEDE